MGEQMDRPFYRSRSPETAKKAAKGGELVGSPAVRVLKGRTPWSENFS